MPFSQDNPNRNRNYLILIVGLVFAFAIVMGSYVALAIAGQDTDSFIRFLTILVVTLIPSTLSVFRSNTAAQNSQQATDKLQVVQEKVEHVEDKINGTLEDIVKGASAEGAKQAIREVNENG